MRLAYAALLLAVSTLPAFAQREPEIVIPGKPGVPVYINGIDASWSVVEGEFGLDRPGVMTPVVIYRPLLVYVPEGVVPSYFPRDDQHPGYGRLEVVPPADRALPPTAPSFFRSWSSRSASGPVTEYAPFEVPPVVIAPSFGRHRPSPKSNRTAPNSRGPHGTNQESP